MQKEVVRGVRLGAILLAGLLAAVASYRLLHFASTATAEEVPGVLEPAEIPVVPEAPVSPNVPPPPPLKIHRNPPRPRHVEARQPANAILAALPEIETVPVETAPEQRIEKAPEMDESPAPEEPGTDDSPSKSPGRGKRFLKAVGRFLHVSRP